MKMSNKVYDTLKWIAIVALPALATCCTILSGAWDFAYGDQIAGTITAVGTLLGALLGVSNIQYKKTNFKDNSEETVG